MTQIFPNDPSQPGDDKFENTETGQKYEWNDETKAWRRVQEPSGSGPEVPDINDDTHQDGTLDDRYVEIGGDTMGGDLILYPSQDVSPSEEGELAIAAPDDTEIEFRYYGYDGTTRCATIELDTCGKTVDPVIGIQGKDGIFLADFNDVVEVVSDGDMPGSTLGDQRWESSLDDVTWTEELTQAPGDLTVLQADKGKTIRLAQDFTDDKTGNTKTIYSNQIAVTDADPPITKWIAWTAGGSNCVRITTSNPRVITAALYKLETDGSWAYMKDVVTMSGDLDAGTYLIDSAEVNRIDWSTSNDKRTMSFSIDGSSNFDAITSMANTFNQLAKFNQDISGWDWSNVTSWDSTFKACDKFDQPVANFVTDKATTTASMFYGASSFNQPLTGWDTSEVKNMNSMFRDASSFDQSVSHFDTSKNVNFSSMFWHASSFNQDVSSWDVEAGGVFDHMFEEANSFNTPISNWKFASNASVKWIFTKNTAFNSALNWDVSALKNFTDMFKEASVFNHSSVGSWDVSSAESMENMFLKAVKFNQSLSWNSPNLTKMTGMFQEAKEFNSNVALVTTNVTSMENVFNAAHAFNKSIDSWNVSSVTSFENMFYYAIKFDKPLNNWNTSSMESAYRMFYNAEKFNQPLDKWSTGNCTNMGGMFNRAYEFDQDISNWCVTNISSYPDKFSDSGSDGFRDTPNAKHPQWGTCPPRILTNPVIK